MKYIIIIGAVIVLGAYALFRMDGKGPEGGSLISPSPTATTTPAGQTGSGLPGQGSYEAYGPEKLARAEDGKVVLFFRASWCPTCRALDANIRSNLSAIPAGVTILDVDYDNSTALKQKYGVTYQHTLVQVDASGNQIAKWSNSPTLSDIVSHLK